MVLNHEEIKELNKDGYITGIDSLFIRNASYDLITESIIDMEGESYSFYKLPPQGMAYVVFKEKLNLPKHIIAFAHVKTSLTQKGIMATNIGIIDPGYQGYISTLLINFGSKHFSLSKGDPYLRLTFNSIDQNYQTEKINGSKSFDSYINDRKRDTDNLDQKFLNLSSVSNDVFGRVMKYLVGLGIIFSAASFAISIYFQNKTSNEKIQEKELKRYEIQAASLVEQNKLLQSKLDVLADSTKNMSKDIDNLKKKK